MVTEKENLVEVEHLKMYFPVNKGVIWQKKNSRYKSCR